MKEFWKRFIHTPSVDWDAKKEGWKAALEWVHSTLDYSIEQKEVGYTIDKELQE